MTDSDAKVEALLELAEASKGVFMRITRAADSIRIGQTIPGNTDIEEAYTRAQHVVSRLNKLRESV
jgi:hypothetical protein